MEQGQCESSDGDTEIPRPGAGRCVLCAEKSDCRGHVRPDAGCARSIGSTKCRSAQVGARLCICVLFDISCLTSIAPAASSALLPLLCRLTNGQTHLQPLRHGRRSRPIHRWDFPCFVALQEPRVYSYPPRRSYRAFTACRRGANHAARNSTAHVVRSRVTATGLLLAQSVTDGGGAATRSWCGWNVVAQIPGAFLRCHCNPSDVVCGVSVSM